MFLFYFSVFFGGWVVLFCFGFFLIRIQVLSELVVSKELKEQNQGTKNKQLMEWERFEGSFLDFCSFFS